MGRPPKNKKIESGAEAIDNILGKKEEKVKVDSTNITTINKDGVYEVPFSDLKPENPPGLFPSSNQMQKTKTTKKVKKVKYIKVDDELLALMTDMYSDVVSGMLCTKIKTGPNIKLDRETMSLKVRPFKRWIEIIQAFVSKLEENIEEK